MLKGTKVILRAIEPDDIDLLYKWENNSQIWHLSNTLTPFSRFVLEQYITTAHLDIYTNKQLRLIIELNEVNKSVGCIDLFEFDPTHKRAGVGIMIDKQFRNKGYAKEALQLLIQYAFNTLHLHQLYCNISKDNIKSLSLFMGCEFQKVGLKKEWNLINGVWEDEYLLQLIKVK